MQGYALRSRCDLVCDGAVPLELVHPDGSAVAIAIDRKQARTLYETAYGAAQKAGFALSSKPLELKPQDKLVEIVRKSQELALAGKGSEEEEAGGDDTGSGN